MHADLPLLWWSGALACFMTVVQLTPNCQLFLILGLGIVLCPTFDKAWNLKELVRTQAPNIMHTIDVPLRSRTIRAAVTTYGNTAASKCKC